MKRKYLSALLMGTLTVASVSTFTSCKDYDDDISNLQEQIDKLATADQLKQKVEELQALISSNKSDITSLQTELAKKTTLEEVKAVLADYATKQYVNDADKTLQDAIDALKTGDIAKLKEDVVKAQAAADKAAKDAEAANAEIVETLKTLATKTELKDAADAAQKAIEALESKNAEDLKKAQEAITETLKSYATKSDVEDGDKKTLESLASTIKNASDALALANTNKQAIADALKLLGEGYSAENTVAAAIEAIKAQIGTPKKELGTLDSRLAAIESVLNGVKDDDTKLGLATKVTNIETQLKDIIGQYSTMVTDVQLFKFTTAVTGFDQKLNFVQAEELDNVFPGEGVADAQFKFEKGKYFVGEDSLLVRVSPVDAELTTSNVSLLNSQGKELNDLIEVTGAHRYDGLLTSRATGDVNTGLWVVKFKAKDLGDAFKAAAAVKKNNADKNILYSVAVKNTYTTDETKDRRVTSEYGVTLATEKANHAYDFTVNGTSINDIHNRYYMCDDSTSTRGVQELVWTNNDKPSTTVITEGNKANAANRHNGQDNRHWKNILAVEKGGDIVIDFTKENGTNKDFGVKGFYVTLDEKFALESAPSELNAWNSYSYVNVGYKKNGTTYQKAKLFTGNTGIIKIEDLGNVKGDVIGFRVYAVNYDGTLTDPDGRAFYVAVGDAKVDMTIPATTVSLDKATASTAQPKFVSPKVAVDFSKYDFDANDAWVVTAEDKDHKKPTEFTVKYFKADGTEVNQLSKDVKSVQFVLTAPNKFIDDETYTVSTTLKKNISGATAEVGTVTASFKKVMPTEAPTFGYRDGFDKFEYIIPTNDYTVAADAEGNYINKSGKFDFRNILIINNNATAWNGFDLFGEGVFNFKVANGTYNWDNNNNKFVLTDAKATISGAEQYILNVNNGGANLVDNKTERTITADFVYKNISKQLVENANGEKEYQNVDYTQPSPSSEKIVYCSWMKTFDVAANGGDNWTGRAEVKDNKGNVKVSYIAPANVVTWSQTATATTLDLSKVDAKVADLKVIPSSVAGTVKGTDLKTFFTNGVIALVKGKYGTVWTTSTDGKQINPYFTAEFTNGNIVLTQSNQTTIPSNVKGGLIHFTVRDCFGNLKAIQLPFVIKMPEVTAKKH